MRAACGRSHDVHGTVHVRLAGVFAPHAELLAAGNVEDTAHRIQDCLITGRQPQPFVPDVGFDDRERLVIAAVISQPSTQPLSRVLPHAPRQQPFGLVQAVLATANVR